MKSVYLSPSAQERNVGAGNYGTEEKRCNQIADVVEQILAYHGIKVYRNEPSMSLAQIVEDSNSKNPKIHFAIHTNAFNKKARGCEIFCHKFGYNGEKLARAVYARISKLTPVGDRGVKEGYNFYNGKPMYETCYTTASAALIEVEFHDNPNGAKWIIENIELIGIEIARGILDYFGVKFVPETKEPDTFYRVVTGSYSEKENAENQIKRLKKAGFDSFIAVYKI